MLSASMIWLRVTATPLRVSEPWVGRAVILILVRFGPRLVSLKE